MHPFTLVFLVFLAAMALTRLWLSRRQERYILAHRDSVPAAFAEKIALEDHHKAADYSIAKLRLGRWSLAWEALWLLIWTLGGGIDFIDQWWRAQELGPLATGIGVILSITLLMSLLDLPFSWYSTFVIEQRFGFNKMTLKLWISDLLKAGVLMLVIGIPLVAAILWLMNQAGEWWWLYAWGVWAGFTLLMIWAYPSFIAPLFNKFEPLQDESLKQRIENLLQRAGFHSQGVFVIDGSKRSAHGNAYFTGFGRNKRIVFYDTLLESLSPEEVEAVLAHELGHFKRHHIRKSLALSLLVALGGFALLAWLMQQPWFYTALGVSTPSTHAALVLFMLVLPVFSFFLGPLFAMLSRKHEFEADEFASQQSNPRALISALVNLYRENASTLTPDPVHSAFYDSHPPASIRIQHLERLAHSG